MEGIAAEAVGYTAHAILETLPSTAQHRCMDTWCNGNILAFQAEARGSIPRVQYGGGIADCERASVGRAVVGYTVHVASEPHMRS
jgi:hypothetical protein